MMPFQRSCKQVSALLVAREDRSLGWRDQLGLRMHMAICAACPVFERQMLTVSNVLRRWRNYRSDDTTP